MASKEQLHKKMLELKEFMITEMEAKLKSKEQEIIAMRKRLSQLG